MTNIRRVTLLTLLAALLVVGSVASAADKEVPFLGGRVNDLAGLLTDSTKTELEAKLEALENATGTQVAVLTIPSLDGEVLEDYSLRVAETWKLGRGKFDDGALLLIARDDRKMRLEVGYGLEGTIPDAYSNRILDDVMQPRFRAGDFDGGVLAAIDVISGLIQGDESLPPPTAQRGSPASDGGVSGVRPFLMFLGFFILMFSLQALTARAGVAWFLYFFLMPFWLIFPLTRFGAPGGFIPLVLWIVGFPILRRIFGGSSSEPPTLGPRAQFGSGKFFGPGGGWSSSGGSFGGGFSGGGGGFGGGGASGSW